MMIIGQKIMWPQGPCGKENNGRGEMRGKCGKTDIDGIQWFRIGKCPGGRGGWELFCTFASLSI
jgi:hypothetical protein